MKTKRLSKKELFEQLVGFVLNYLKSFFEISNNPYIIEERG